jgi:hypothetical protein
MVQFARGGKKVAAAQKEAKTPENLDLVNSHRAHWGISRCVALCRLPVRII